MSPTPLRVLVKGASTVNWTSWMGGPRTDFTFPRVVEEVLLRHDQPCHVQTISMASEKTSWLLRTWQREVVQFSPDVIVLVYGHYESIHLFLPRWFERHANSLRGRPRRLAQLYRRRILRPTWKALAQLQAAVDRRVPRLRPGRPRRVAEDLRAYVHQVQKVGSPLVLMLELLPLHDGYTAWFPGMSQRIEDMNRAIGDMVADLDLPNVQHVPIRPVVEEVFAGDLTVATPDGFHYSPPMHLAVGERVAAVVMDWARSQPHLALGDAAVDRGERSPSA